MRKKKKTNIKDEAWLLGFMSYLLLLEQLVLLFSVFSPHYRWRHSCWPALISLSENTSAHQIPVIHTCPSSLSDTFDRLRLESACNGLMGMWKVRGLKR